MDAQSAERAAEHLTTSPLYRGAFDHAPRIGPNLQWLGTVALVTYGIGPNACLPDTLAAWRTATTERLLAALRGIDTHIELAAYAQALLDDAHTLVWTLPFAVAAAHNGAYFRVIDVVRTNYPHAPVDVAIHRDALLALSLIDSAGASEQLHHRAADLMEAATEQQHRKRSTAYEIAHLALYRTHFGRHRDPRHANPAVTTYLQTTAHSALLAHDTDLAAELIAALAATDTTDAALPTLRAQLAELTKRHLGSPAPGRGERHRPPAEETFHQAATYLLAVCLRR